MRLAYILALLFSGAAPVAAQGFADTRPSARVQVAELVIDRLPRVQLDGDAWDSFSSPDPWIIVTNGLGETIAQLGPFQDLAASYYPLRVPLGLSFAPNERFRIVIYDQDVSEHDVIAIYDLALSTPGLPGFANTQSLTGPDGRPLGELHYTWGQ